MAADSRPHSRSESSESFEGDSILNTRSIEAFSRKVTATANQLIGEGSVQHYHSALGDIHRELRHPTFQRRVFNLAQASPRELVRSKLSVAEIRHRALTYVPDDLLQNIPENKNTYSLFQGFQATVPESQRRKRRHGRRHSKEQQKLLEDSSVLLEGQPAVAKLRNEKQGLDHQLEMITVRKNMCSTEIREIDKKIANLNDMRKLVLDRLESLEADEAEMENDLLEVETKIEDLAEQLEDEAILAEGQRTPTQSSDADGPPAGGEDSPGVEASFMSDSIYQKIPATKPKRPRPGRRKTTYILHEHLQAGSKLRELQAHNDTISALDFDAPFGTMVTAALDDTVRVWDLHAGRCMGLLEGHLSSVRCLQVEDNLVATGSMDASVRLWDLSQADYTPPPPPPSNLVNKLDDDDEGERHSSLDEDEDDDFADADERAPMPPPSSMRDCLLFTLSAHVAEVTALHFHNTTLISGSADKTLRQWDLEKGRCVQTLDVLWAAAQASSTISPADSASEASAPPSTSSSSSTTWRPSSRVTDASADFVGALQCFDAALACGTADGMVRLWDLRSGQVHRSLVGHTGPVTCLQFDDTHLVTGSLDRSIRIWDLRTGTIYDAFAFANPITSMMFDARRIVAAAGEDVVKVYDKTDGHHWDCGAGAGDIDGALTEGSGGSGHRGRTNGTASLVQRVRLKDGYLLEGRRDGIVGAWSC